MHSVYIRAWFNGKTLKCLSAGCGVCEGGRRDGGRGQECGLEGTAGTGTHGELGNC